MTPNFFGWSEAVWRLIDQIGILFGLAMGLTWFGGLLFAILRPDTLKRWFFATASLTSATAWRKASAGTG